MKAGNAQHVAALLGCPNLARPTPTLTPSLFLTLALTPTLTPSPTLALTQALTLALAVALTLALTLTLTVHPNLAGFTVNVFSWEQATGCLDNPKWSFTQMIVLILCVLQLFGLW